MVLPFDARNHYPMKQLLVQSIADLALLSTSVLQLKFVLKLRPGNGHPLDWVVLFLIVASMCVQVFEVICCVALCCMWDVARGHPCRRATICVDVGVAMVMVMLSLVVIIYGLELV